MLTKEQLAVLQDAYSKENLEKGLFSLVRQFFLTRPSGKWAEVNVHAIVSLLNSQKTFNKTQIAQICFTVFQNEDILKDFLHSLPQHINKLIGKLLFIEEMDDTEVSKFLSKEIAQHNYNRSELKREFYFFNVKIQRQYISYSTTKTVFLLSLHPLLKNLLVNHFPKPVYYNFIPLDEIPATNIRFSAEHLIQGELPRLLSYNMQENIKYNSSGRPADGTLSKLRRICNTAEFYTSDDAEISKIRSMLLAGLLYDYLPKTLSASNTEIIKELFSNHYFKLNSPVFVLQQLKGWQHVGRADLYKDAEKKLQNVLRLLPADKWISTENLHEYLNTRSIDLKAVTMSSATNYLTYEGWLFRGSLRIPEKKEIEYDTYNPMVKTAFVTGSLFLYAAFGLIEIAYNNIDTTALGHSYFSCYDGLQYFRLTPLGAYVLGVAKEYENANAGKTNSLTFDGDSLVILAEGDLEVINVSLANYAERLANNRFRVTNNCFLKDCKNERDIQKKIALFRNTVGTKLPANWEAFFAQLLNNAKAVEELPYIHTYQLPPAAKELHRLVAQDSELKQLVLKAENFHILVTSTNVAKFKSRMKDLGYLIE